MNIENVALRSNLRVKVKYDLPFDNPNDQKL